MPILSFNFKIEIVKNLVFFSQNKNSQIKIFNNLFQVDESELEAELEALGDEIALDGDASYLDEAVAAPPAPSREPCEAVKF